MDERQVFILADQTLKYVVDTIKDDQWDMVMPAEFAMAEKTDSITLRKVINYHAYDDAWVPDMFSGKTMEEAGKGKFDGDLLGNNPKESFANYVKTACDAVEKLENFDQVVHYSYGDFPASEALEHITSFRGLRAHDIAKVIGGDGKLPEDLVQGLWDQISPQAEYWREMGVFGPAVEVPEDAPLQDRLLGLTGRQP